MKTDLDTIKAMFDRAAQKYELLTDERWPGTLLQSAKKEYDSGNPGYQDTQAVMWFDEDGALVSIGGWEG